MPPLTLPLDTKTPSEPVLFDAALHEPLAETAWDEDAARGNCDRIVAEALAAFDPKILWPCHPQDHEDGDAARTIGYTSLYLGAAGIAWALRRLTGSSPLDADALVAAFEAEPDIPDMRYGLLLGEAGVALVAHEFDPSPERADLLEAAIRDAIPRTERELLWAAPGAIHAALAAHAAVPDDRWLACIRDAVNELWTTLEPPNNRSIRLWSQDLYGKPGQHILGLGHGFAGNAHALLRSGDLLGRERRDALIEVIVALLDATATWNGNRANWTPALEDERPISRAQICHGAAGMVVAFASVPAGVNRRLDQLLLAGGETTWLAGPIERGSGLCHGTAGNGYAFLKLYERTGAPLWLDRARAFAMHALAQCECERQSVGHGHHSLWTGDLILPFFVEACATGTSEIAGLELL